ncbi:hypothetical protein QE152_g10682 [Popillia japonica]|uniref:Uncharacterized protein n=1 Tax=Popillia japonica TaxID=7064 RepID=A0AAW1LSL8_POPJA
MTSKLFNIYMEREKNHLLPAPVLLQPLIPLSKRIKQQKLNWIYTPATNTTIETNKTTEIKLDLCEIWTNKFLITSNHHMYVFYKEWVWIVNIEKDVGELARVAKYINAFANEHPNIF